MFKRQHFHEKEGASSSDADSESDLDPEEQGELHSDTADSQDEGSVEEENEGDCSDEGDDNGNEDPDTRRLEDLSEDDFDNDEDEELLSLKEQWLAASKEEADKLPKRALSCRLCKGVLMLGPASLKQHLASKRHQGRLKRKKADDYEPICFAADLQEADLETHEERLKRLKDTLAAPATKESAAGKGRRARRRDAQKMKKKQGKLGKRERAELKAEGGKSKDGGGKLKATATALKAKGGVAKVAGAPRPKHAKSGHRAGPKEGAPKEPAVTKAPSGKASGSLWSDPEPKKEPGEGHQGRSGGRGRGRGGRGPGRGDRGGRDFREESAGGRGGRGGRGPGRGGRRGGRDGGFRGGHGSRKSTEGREGTKQDGGGVYPKNRKERRQKDQAKAKAVQ